MPIRTPTVTLRAAAVSTTAAFPGTAPSPSAPTGHCCWDHCGTQVPFPGAATLPTVCSPGPAEPPGRRGMADPAVHSGRKLPGQDGAGGGCAEDLPMPRLPAADCDRRSAPGGLAGVDRRRRRRARAAATLAHRLLGTARRPRRASAGLLAARRQISGALSELCGWLDPIFGRGARTSCSVPALDGQGKVWCRWRDHPSRWR